MSALPSRAGDARASRAGSLASYTDTRTVASRDDEADGKHESFGGGRVDISADEKSHHGGNAKTTTIARLDSTSPISKVYLSFASELPPPAALELDDGSPIPSPPDLNHFLSPSEWTLARKVLTLTLSCVATFLTACAPAVYSPPASLMALDFHTSRLVVMIGVTSYCTGFALTPMVLAPLSEIRGRRPVFIAAGAFFVLFQGLSSVMPDVAGMIICRFFAGVGASVFSTVVGGVLADVYANHERNTPMAIFAGSALVAAGVGPLVGAAMIKNLGPDTLTWKWTFWLQTIGNALLVITLFLFFPESRRSVLLSKKARVLNRWYEKLECLGVYGVFMNCDPSAVPETSSSASSSVTSVLPLPATPSGDIEAIGDGFKTPVGIGTMSRKQPQRIRWVVKEDEERASLVQIIAISIKRPFQLLVTEPVVFCFSLWAAFSWAVLYLSFSIVPLLYTDSDSFNESMRVYVALMLASVAGTLVSIYQERLLKHPQWMRHPDGERFAYSGSRFWALMRRRFPAEAPEARLYFAAVTAVLLPVGLFLALMTEIRDGSYAQAVGLGLAVWGIYAVYLSTFNYLADTYHTYASSALAAQSCCRNLLGGAFPLLAGIMFERLGPKGMGGLLGGVATVLTLIPWVLIFFGDKIRSKSKVALSLGQS